MTTSAATSREGGLHLSLKQLRANIVFSSSLERQPACRTCGGRVGQVPLQSYERSFGFQLIWSEGRAEPSLPFPFSSPFPFQSSRSTLPCYALVLLAVLVAFVSLSVSPQRMPLPRLQPSSTSLRPLTRHLPLLQSFSSTLGRMDIVGKSDYPPTRRDESKILTFQSAKRGTVEIPDRSSPLLLSFTARPPG